MNLIDAIKKRRSIREFKKDIVTDEQLRTIIELAKLAPSAGNLQSYQVAIVREESLTNIFAPVNLVVCADMNKSESRYGERGRTLFSIQDATIFASYIQLIAVELGLATVWIGAFNESKIREKLSLSDNLRPIIIMLLGYPKINKEGIGNRRKFEEIIL